MRRVCRRMFPSETIPEKWHRHCFVLLFAVVFCMCKKPFKVHAYPQSFLSFVARCIRKYSLLYLYPACKGQLVSHAAQAGLSSPSLTCICAFERQLGCPKFCISKIISAIAGSKTVCFHVLHITFLSQL